MITLALDLACKSTIALAFGLLITKLLSKASAATRHLVCLFTLVAILLLPILSIALPAWRVLPNWSSSPIDQPNNSAHISAAQSATASVQRIGTNNASISNQITSPAIAGRLNWVNIFACLYLAGVGIGLVSLLLAVVALGRLGRRASPLPAGPWHPLLEDTKRLIGTNSPVTLLVTENAAMPMTWGWLKHVILLPGEARNWSPERRRLVLLHELAHVKRGDSLSQFIAQLTRAVYWFHPLVWMATRQIRIEAELACDDLVVAVDARPTTYADQLLEIASSFRAAIFSTAAIAMARADRSQLHIRIQAILQPTRNRNSPSRRAAGGLLVSMVILLVPLAMLQARAQSTKPSSSVPTVAVEFPFSVPFETTDSVFKPGDNITITEIHGTASALTPGNRYLIKGTYTLVSANSAMLAVWVTTASRHTENTLERRRTVNIEKGSGEFTLVLPFSPDGQPHVSMYPSKGGQSLGGVYFKAGPKASVLIQVSPTQIYFQGSPTTWDELPDLLIGIPDRANTVLAFALTSDQMTVAQYHDVLFRVTALSKQFGFRNPSDAGIKPTTEPSTAQP